MLYRSLAKPLLFKMDPEQAHHLIIGGLSGMGSIRPVPSGLRVMYGVRETEDLAVDMFGCHFPTQWALQQDWTKRTGRNGFLIHWIRVHGSRHRNTAGAARQ